MPCPLGSGLDERERIYELQLMQSDVRIPAQARVLVQDWTEGERRHRPCTVTLSWNERSVSRTAHSVYHALRDVRALLEPEGIVLDCYGSCPDVLVSGMLIDMGDGTLAYRMSRASSNDRPPTVNIFETEPGLQLGSVAEQDTYRDNLVKAR